MDKYVEAMGRKLDIAEYHLAVLRELLPCAKPDEHNLPPVPLQAHFEACGRAIVAMLDQLASGIASEVPGMPEVHKASPKKVIKWLSGSMHPKASELKRLIEHLDDDCRINDLRDIRNRSTHRFDVKQFSAGVGWIVNLPQYLPTGVAKCKGSRQLSEYLQTMVEYGQEVIVAVPEAQKLAKVLSNDGDS